MHGASEYIKDDIGDLRINERVFDCLDISSVKVATEDRKSFTFEVKMKSPVNVAGKEACYVIVAVNLDGDMATGTTAWTPGQDFCAFIDIEGKEVKRTRDQRAQEPEALSGAVIDGNTLRFTLQSDIPKRKRITFNVLSIVRRQSSDGKVPYSTLDSSASGSARYNEFKF